MMTEQSDEQAIIGILRRYEQAVNDGDLDTWLSLWGAQAIRMVPNAPTAVGTEQIRTSATNMFPPNVTKMAVEIDEVRPLGDWAIGRGTYTYTASPGGADTTLSGSGKYLSIFFKESDGTWKFARDCFNEDAPS